MASGVTRREGGKRRTSERYGGEHASALPARDSSRDDVRRPPDVLQRFADGSNGSPAWCVVAPHLHEVGWDRRQAAGEPSSVAISCAAACCASASARRAATVSSSATSLPPSSAACPCRRPSTV